MFTGFEVGVLLTAPFGYLVLRDTAGTKLRGPVVIVAVTALCFFLFMILGAKLASHVGLA